MPLSSDGYLVSVGSKTFSSPAPELVYVGVTIFPDFAGGGTTFSLLAIDLISVGVTAFLEQTLANFR